MPNRLCVICLFTSVIFGFTTIIPNKLLCQPDEFATLRLNFYMMGLDSVDQYRIDMIHSNVDSLNAAFEGHVKFEINNIKAENKGALLPDIYANYLNHNIGFINELVNPVEETGGINIFLFETYSEEVDKNALLGFTPILRAKQIAYEMTSPKFDRIYMAYPGLLTQSTLIHEMGHFLGLKHPWDMHRLNLELMGLDDDSVLDKNHMTYSLNVSEFTSEQLVRMNHFALTFRSYLSTKPKTSPATQDN